MNAYRSCKNEVNEFANIIGRGGEKEGKKLYAVLTSNPEKIDSVKKAIKIGDPCLEKSFKLWRILVERMEVRWKS